MKTYILYDKFIYFIIIFEQSKILAFKCFLNGYTVFESLCSAFFAHACSGAISKIAWHDCSAAP